MKHASARRKDAVVCELAIMGISQTGIARLVGKTAPFISQICKRAGVKPSRERSGWEPQRTKSRERAANMLALYKAGRTLEEIGQQYGLTRERVRQLMTKHFGTRQNDGGQHARMEARRERFEAARNSRCLKKWGCGWDQYVAIRDMKKPTRAYASQMRNAFKRGIGWDLTLWQWWTIWQSSGHWDERGRGQGYVMCRNGDTGPYAVGNVSIATGVQNSSEGQSRFKKDPALPIGVRRTKSGKFLVVRCLAGERLYLGTHDTVDLAYVAWLRAAEPTRAAA